MGIGVVHDLMPRLAECLDGFRVFIHPLPYHKKGRLYLVPAQNINELLGVLVPPGRIEADRQQLLVLLDAVDGQLPGGGRGTYRSGVVDQVEHERRKAQA